jgi:tRNA(His) guanylyltransferase
MQAMNEVALALCHELQGAQLAYVQSDEVSVLIHPYKRHHSQPVFDGEVQKLASISAAIAASTWGLFRPAAVFDGRAFVIPEADVCNYFIWRQQDATRNSVQMAARAVFSHAQCDNKNTSELQEMLFQKGINWNDYPPAMKRGRCVVRDRYDSVGVERQRWVVVEPPIFTQDRAYIEKWLAVESEEPSAEVSAS